MIMGNSRISSVTMIAYIPRYKAMSLSVSGSIIYIGYTPFKNISPPEMKSTDWRLLCPI